METRKRRGDLAMLSCIAFESQTSGAHEWTFAAADSELSVPLHPRLSVNTAEAAIDAAIAGVGVTRVLSYQVAREVADGRLQIVLADYELEPLPISLVHVGQNPLPLKTRAFLDFAAPRIRERATAAALHDRSN